MKGSTVPDKILVHNGKGESDLLLVTLTTGPQRPIKLTTITIIELYPFNCCFRKSCSPVHFISVELLLRKV
jgi:hypothetical protein